MNRESPKVRVTVGNFRVIGEGPPSDTPRFIIENIDLRCAERDPTANTAPTVVQVLTGQRALGALGSNVALTPRSNTVGPMLSAALSADSVGIEIRDCAVDSNLTIGAENCAINLRESSVGSLGYVDDAELRHHRDEFTEASVIGAGGRSAILARSIARAGKENDEPYAATSMANALGRLDGAAYGSEVTGDDGCVDAYVLRPGKPSVALQVTQLSPQFTERLRGRARLSRFDENQTLFEIQAVIHRKSTGVDPVERARMLLVLFFPAPVPRQLREKLTRHHFDPEGFPGLWVTARGTDAFELTRSRAREKNTTA